MEFYRNCLGPTLEAAKFDLSGKTISRLKPMLAYGFEEYTLDCSHEAWADLDIILGNLTKFLVRPLSKGHDVVSMSAVDFS